MPLRTYEHFASRDQLKEIALERMLAGVSTRNYRRAGEPVGEEIEERSTSKSSISRAFVERTRHQLWMLMNRPLAGLDVEQGVLFIIDGSKALRKAIRQVFGSDVPVRALRA